MGLGTEGCTGRKVAVHSKESQTTPSSGEKRPEEENGERKLIMYSMAKHARAGAVIVMVASVHPSRQIDLQVESVSQKAVSNMERRSDVKDEWKEVRTEKEKATKGEVW